MISKSSKVIFALSTVFAASSAMASGYGVKLQNAWTQGMANAGSGVMDDPLAIYANPAAMIQNNTHQVSGSLTGVFGVTKFSGKNQLNESGTSRNAAKKVAVPSFGVVANAHERLKLGMMVHAPFGLKFNYGNNSITKAHSTRAEMRAMNLTPSLALKLVDWLSVGTGLQLQYTTVELARKVTISPLGLPGTLYSRVNGNNWSMGWMAGIFAQITKAWKVGLSYKSKMDCNITGQGEIGTLTGILVDNFAAKAKVYFPAITTLSTSYDLTSKLTAYVDVIYTHWNIVKNITVTSFTNTNGTAQDVIPLRWKNSWFYSVGGNYKINDSWSVRAGYAFDNAPSRDATRVASIPDCDKHWVAVGATYSVGPKMSMTLSYGHEFFKKGKINLTDPVKGTLNGRVKNHVDLIAAQFNYKF
ncbi:OmpP1/FadL family transporter [Candidatus Odyssella thessalonicensis]|uniref:OmpP1/FadL family transporter n=1 Tax=Candidatus Odyssella thessalonicensis TaxID=84647 RepID=UPI000225C1A9|nr:OmpP1/FadL family transporter [Candidatus Odyssella thessalonicensis]